MPGMAWYAIGLVVVLTIVTLVAVFGDRWYAKRIRADRGRRADLERRAREQRAGARRRPGQ